MNAFDQMRQALEEANGHFRAADRAANAFAGIIAGRLRQVDSYTLKKLKRELRDFNLQSGRWKP